MSGNYGKARSQRLKPSTFCMKRCLLKLGVAQNGKACRTWGDIGLLSFYPTRILGALWWGQDNGLTQHSNSKSEFVLLTNHGQPRRRRTFFDRATIVRIVRCRLRVFKLLCWIRLRNFLVWSEAAAKRYLDSLMEIIDLILSRGGFGSWSLMHIFFVILSSGGDELQDIF